jgi:hypothetical protein
MSSLRRFAAFLYDFLVGDFSELFIGAIAILLVAWIAVSAGVAGWVVGCLLVVAVIALAALSVAAGLREAG